jgi:hypothetical protein
MIQLRLSLEETRLLLQETGLLLAHGSPLTDPLDAVPEVPLDSPAADTLRRDLVGRGLLLADGRCNPVIEASLGWLADPEETWTLALFGPGGVEAVHLALRGDAGVECILDSAGLQLSFPLRASEAQTWMETWAGGEA